MINFAKGKGGFNMSIRTFLKLVEINTKLASLFPFLIGSLFVLYYFGKFNVLNTLIFFCSMLIFDLTTTAINNYMDYKKATTDAYRREHNIIGQRNVPEPYVVGRSEERRVGKDGGRSVPV